MSLASNSAAARTCTLHRTASGKFDVADAIRLEDLVKLPEAELPAACSLVGLAHLLQPE